MPVIINEDQNGFIKDRYIGENTRIIFDILEYTELHDISGILLQIDFEKAFDSVDQEFIIQVETFTQVGSSSRS